ncbi:MAG TPA: transposase [Candidatus Sulfotelmatobacter sp.]|nr:transposase [Candidatus Sulfotelmatobacter sp.]
MPHFECNELPQHVTFHLADSLAKNALRKLESQLQFLPQKKRSVERRKRLEEWIDAGHGSCVLRRPEIATVTQASLLKFDAQRYRLLAWVVMPNHVHALFKPVCGWTVSQIVAAWKKFTARRICDWQKDLGEEFTRPVWHREYWDRYIRDQRHLAQTVEYIHLNPVKAGLVDAAENWVWSSAFQGNANRDVSRSFRRMSLQIGE